MFPRQSPPAARPSAPARRHLPLFGRLDRYVAGNFAWSYLTALLLIVGLFWILDLAANVDDYIEPDPRGDTPPALEVARFHVLNLPYIFLQVGPFVTFLAGMFTVSRLLKRNEVVAVLAAGVSAHRLLLPVFLGGFLAAALMFAAREWTAAYVAEPRDALRDSLKHHRPRPVYRDLWLGDLAGSMVRMGQFLPATESEPAEIVGLEANVAAASGWAQVSAERAVWSDGRWRLEGGERRVVRARTEERAVDTVEWLEGFDVTPQDALTARRARDEPLELSFGEVRKVIRRDPDDVVYQTLWQYHLTFPLANLILLLVGLPVLLRHERGRSAERMALGALLCVVYFAVDFVFRDMGLKGELSPILASWVPILAFGSLGIVLVEGMRT